MKLYHRCAGLEKLVIELEKITLAFVQVGRLLMFSVSFSMVFSILFCSEKVNHPSYPNFQVY